jgi:hypothetical protein
MGTVLTTFTAPLLNLNYAITCKYGVASDGEYVGITCRLLRLVEVPDERQENR